MVLSTGWYPVMSPPTPVEMLSEGNCSARRERMTPQGINTCDKPVSASAVSGMTMGSILELMTITVPLSSTPFSIIFDRSASPPIKRSARRPLGPSCTPAPSCMLLNDSSVLASTMRTSERPAMLRSAKAVARPASPPPTTSVVFASSDAFIFCSSSVLLEPKEEAFTNAGFVDVRELTAATFCVFDNTERGTNAVAPVIADRRSTTADW
mmetsp:Transcript_60591/g.70890  ORF Transcript_60591/g.70890 Transcript_60591/m.70890 type:complete len:210 (+) Transcript_60591:1017-1646(+)